MCYNGPMKSYRDPSFQERVQRAAEAKKKALDQLRARPPIDEAVQAARIAASTKRAAVSAGKAEAKKAAKQRAIDAVATAPAPPTEAELKARRDAKYAARKRRK